MKKYNLLIVLTSNFPIYLKSGGHVAVYHMIDGLREQFNISIIYKINKRYKKLEYELRGKWDNVAFYPIYTSLTDIKNTSFLRKLALMAIDLIIVDKYSKKESLLRPLSCYNYSNELFNMINFVVDKDHIDIIQTEFYGALHLIHGLPLKVKKTFVQHEIRFVRNQRFMDTMTPLRSIDRFLFNKNKAEEIAAMNQYDAVITLSEKDKTMLLENNVRSEIYSSPAIVDTLPVIINDEYNYDNRIVFLGGSAHSPNVGGLKWFLNNIWNEVLLKHPNIELDIIGDWDRKERVSILCKYKNIKFLGFVEDIKKAMTNSIMVVPLLIGSGMRMKIMEAARLGIPFLSTTVGVEGLDFKGGVDCLIADTPEDFINSLSLLQTNSFLQKRLIKNSQKRYKLSYSSDVLLKRRNDIYKDIIMRPLHNSVKII